MSSHIPFKSQVHCDEGTLLFREVSAFAHGGARGESTRADHPKEHQSFTQTTCGEAGPGQCHHADRSTMMPGDEESKSFTRTVLHWWVVLLIMRSSAARPSSLCHKQNIRALWTCLCTHGQIVPPVSKRTTSHQMWILMAQMPSGATR